MVLKSEKLSVSMKLFMKRNLQLMMKPYEFYLANDPAGLSERSFDTYQVVVFDPFILRNKLAVLLKPPG